MRGRKHSHASSPRSPRQSSSNPNCRDEGAGFARRARSTFAGVALVEYQVEHPVSRSQDRRLEPARHGTCVWARLIRCCAILSPSGHESRHGRSAGWSSRPTARQRVMGPPAEAGSATDRRLQEEETAETCRCCLGRVRAGAGFGLDPLLPVGDVEGPGPCCGGVREREDRKRKTCARHNRDQSSPFRGRRGCGPGQVSGAAGMECFLAQLLGPSRSQNSAMHEDAESPAGSQLPQHQFVQSPICHGAGPSPG